MKPEIVDRAIAASSPFKRWQKTIFWIMLLSFILAFPFAFVNRTIMIDEAWIGEQVKALLDHGTIVTNLFRDYPPLDQQIVIYHKLLVWFGVVSSAIWGWGLYSLRLVSAVAGFATLGVFFWYQRRFESHRAAIIATGLLLWTPLFWEMMRIYRPEMLVTCLGFTSYAVLHFGDKKKKLWLIGLAGLLSGMSGAAHPAGMAFAAAGCMALLFAGKFQYTVVFLIASLCGFFPYLSGLVTNYDLASRQLLHNETMASMVRIEWWSPLLNLIEEHKRLFRQPMVIGISVMFIISLFFAGRSEFKRRKLFWIYLTTLFLCGAMLPFPKITRYMLPLTPFFAIACARVIDRLLDGQLQPPKILRIALVSWIGIFILYGGFALGRAALIDRLAPKEIAAHKLLAQQMTRGTLVMAPAKFIFPEVDSFTIQSYWGARVAAGEKRLVQQLDDYAARHDVKYLIIDPETMRDWNFRLPDHSNSLRQYRMVTSVPELKYYLFERIDSSGG